jgi:hypothetical protein
MNERAHAEGEPLVQPMYYDHPWDEAAYSVPHQFMFGTDLLVAPITSPADPVTGLASVNAWLPEGDWIDVFTRVGYSGGRTVKLHRDLDSIPVLARVGTVLPLADGPLELSAPADDIPERIFALLDRAAVPFGLKNEIWRIVRDDEPAQAALALLALDMRPQLLTAVGELLLART